MECHMKFPDKEWLVKVCKFGFGKSCCRYLMCGSNGWECGKENEVMKHIIDENVKSGLFNAIGDNCEGFSALIKVLN